MPHRLLLSLAAVGSLGLLVSCTAQVAPVPGGTRLSVEGNFAAGEEMSGLASADDKLFVFVSNETRAAQLGTVDFAAGKITAGPTLSFPQAPGDAEMDLEAVACDPATGFYYVTGSHAVSKKKGKPRAEQQVIFKFKTDAAGTLAEYEMGTLSNILKSCTAVASKLGEPLQAFGVNIEGLAFWQGKLWVGLRAPVDGDQALLLELPPESAFRVAGADAKVHRLPLGKRMGIRDIAVAKGGLILVSGEAGAPASDKFAASEGWAGDEVFQLWAWQGPQAAPVRLAQLPKENGSVEGLYVQAETDTAYKFLTLRDGQHNGGPQVFEIAKPAASK